MKNDVLMCLGKNVKYYRNKRGMTQLELAEICDKHQHYISDVECGKRNVTIKGIEKIASGLKVPVHKLFL